MRVLNGPRNATFYPRGWYLLQKDFDRAIRSGRHREDGRLRRIDFLSIQSPMASVTFKWLLTNDFDAGGLHRQDAALYLGSSSIQK